jgi:hypothetical protein
MNHSARSNRWEGVGGQDFALALLVGEKSNFTANERMGAPFKNTMKAMQVMNRLGACKLRNEPEVEQDAKGRLLLIAILSDAGAASVEFPRLVVLWYSTRS